MTEAVERSVAIRGPAVRKTEEDEFVQNHAEGPHIRFRVRRGKGIVWRHGK